MTQQYLLSTSPVISCMPNPSVAATPAGQKATTATAGYHVGLLLLEQLACQSASWTLLLQQQLQQRHDRKQAQAQAAGTAAGTAPSLSKLLVLLAEVISR